DYLPDAGARWSPRLDLPAETFGNHCGEDPARPIEAVREEQSRPADRRTGSLPAGGEGLLDVRGTVIIEHQETAPARKQDLTRVRPLDTALCLLFSVHCPLSTVH